MVRITYTPLLMCSGQSGDEKNPNPRHYVVGESYPVTAAHRMEVHSV